MRKLTSAALATLLAIICATTAASAGDRILARGEFTATVDFSTLTLTPVDENCLLEVEGVIALTGTLDGIAPARTRALVLASCPEVAATPPGTFKDVFTSKLEFAGTVGGKPAVADINYRGVAKVGGDIRAVMAVSNGLVGVLRVDAVVAEGGLLRRYLVAERLGLRVCGPIPSGCPPAT